MLTPPLADFLRSHRAACNARFAAARRLWPRLDAGDFSLFLRDQLSPLAESLDGLESYAALNQAYELGLQLVAEKLAGPSAVTTEINALWVSVFPKIAPHIAVAPRRILGSLSNAAHHLASTPDTRPEYWRNRLVELAPRCASADELLIVAQVLAWRAGLSQFRASSLAAADSLASDLAIDLLEVPTERSWPEIRDAHLSDPWFGYQAPDGTSRRIGMFRGYGGLFLTPPLVTRSGSQILVRSGEESWILVADAFGTTLHRASPEEIHRAAPVSIPRDASALPAGHKVTSAVILDTTYAVTSAQSHSIWIGQVHTKR
jgi:hypothetical protein